MERTPDVWSRMCGALSYGQHRMDCGQELVMAERLGDKASHEPRSTYHRFYLSLLTSPTRIAKRTSPAMSWMPSRSMIWVR